MAKIDALYQAFNVGVFDRDKLHRVDLERIRLAAERQTNLMPDAVGKATFRAGTEYICTAPAEFRPYPFIAGDDDAFVLILSALKMRVFDQSNGAVVTRPTVTTAVTNGDMGGAGSWTLAATAGQTSAISGGKLNLTARAHGGKASALQQVTTIETGVQHALRIVVDRGPVTFRCGSTSGGDEYIAETQLRTGTHSLAFTPTGDFYIQFSSELPVLKIVDSCTVEAAGVMELTTIWPLAALPLIRGTQSLDVLFCAAEGYRRQRIERRGDASWSVCDYDADDGPFSVGRTANISLTPSVLEGNGTLTASAPFFNSSHVGAIFRLEHQGQGIETYLAAVNQFTPAFRVTGITETNFEERKWTVAITGTWVGTLKHYRSFDGEFGDYHEFRREQASATVAITGNATYTNDDNDDNAEVWYKMGFSAYTSGEAAIDFQYDGGWGFGICRVVGFTNSTTVDIEVLTPFKGKVATENWRQGRYDDVVGQPAAVALVDGRLVWMGNDQFDASISDAYESFDEEYPGDAGPLSRAIALGGRNEARWALSLSTLVVGCNERIADVRASALDESLTPDNFNIHSLGKIGAAKISPVDLADDRGLFVHASGTSIYELPWSGERGRYLVSPFTRLTTDLFSSGIKGMAVQSLPDQRVWVANTDEDAVCIVFEPSQNVLAAHIPISTSVSTDFFEAFCVLPGTTQDRVYASVKRVIGGSTVYYLERFALDSEAKVGDVCKVMDSHVAVTVGNATVTGLSHLNGRNVVAWVDGAPITDPTITDPAEDNTRYFMVSGGEITLPAIPATGGCVGLRYEWEYKSSRLAYGVQGYTPMLKNKSLASLGLMLADFCRSGIKYGTVSGSGFNAPWSLPDISTATGDEADEVVEGPGDDEYSFPAGSEISLDVRVCIAGASPKPATLLALVMGVQTSGS